MRRHGGRAKCDADEPAGSGVTAGARHAGEVDVDGPVPEFRTSQQGYGLACVVLLFVETQRLLSLISDRFRDDVDEFEALGRLQSKAARLGRGVEGNRKNHGRSGDEESVQHDPMTLNRGRGFGVGRAVVNQRRLTPLEMMNIRPE